MELAVSILSSAGVSAVLAAFLVFLFRSWIGERLKNAIKHEYDQKMEVFKAQLQAEHQREIETLKAHLQIATSTHQIQFASLHAKVAEVVAEIYARIVRVKNAVAQYVKVMESSGEPSKEERRKAVAVALAEFQDYYETHRLYLPKESIKIIGEFSDTLWKTTWGFMLQVEMPLAEGERHDIKAWGDAHRTMSETVPLLLENLEDEFRKLLGQAVRPSQNTA
jgi:hypothetical protein